MSTVHRAEFIDRLLLQLIQKHITKNLPKPKSGGHYKKMLKEFKELEKLQSERLSLLTKLHYASYKRDEVLEELRTIGDKINEYQNKISSLFSTKTESNPLIYPLFKTPPYEINTLDLTYRRELVKTLVRRIRFFNEFLIVRLNPITEEDKRKSDEMGRIFHLNLRISNRERKIELPDDKKNETSSDKELSKNESNEDNPDETDNPTDNNFNKIDENHTNDESSSNPI